MQYNLDVIPSVLKFITNDTLLIIIAFEKSYLERVLVREAITLTKLISSSDQNTEHEGM